MLKFEQAIGAEGELTLVGTMQVQSERRRSSAFANLQRGMFCPSARNRPPASVVAN
jgi:hypothetical protein